MAARDAVSPADLLDQYAVVDTIVNLLIVVLYCQDVCRTTASKIIDQVKDRGTDRIDPGPPPTGEECMFVTIEELARFTLKQVETVS